MMDKLKAELNNLLEQYDRLDPRVLKVSQDLDLLIVQDMRKALRAGTLSA